MTHRLSSADFVLGRHPCRCCGGEPDFRCCVCDTNVAGSGCCCDCGDVSSESLVVNDEEVILFEPSEQPGYLTVLSGVEVHMAVEGEVWSTDGWQVQVNEGSWYETDAVLSVRAGDCVKARISPSGMEQLAEALRP